jgi:hypothetical protein
MDTYLFLFDHAFILGGKRGSNKQRRLLNAGYFTSKGSISLAFWMCSLEVRFTVECVTYVIF